MSLQAERYSDKQFGYYYNMHAANYMQLTLSNYNTLKTKTARTAPPSAA